MENVGEMLVLGTCISIVRTFSELSNAENMIHYGPLSHVHYVYDLGCIHWAYEIVDSLCIRY